MSQNDTRTLVKLVDDFSSLNYKLKSWYGLSDKTKTYELINALYRSNYKPTPTTDLITGIVTTDSLQKAVTNISKEQVGLTAWWNYLSDSGKTDFTVSDLVNNIYEYYNQEATAANRFAYVNNVKINPLENNQYYFSSKDLEHGGFKIDLNAGGLVDAEGYYNIKLSKDAFNIQIDSNMQIIGIMLYDSLTDSYKPFGSGKKTIEQMLIRTEIDGFAQYTLSDIGISVANSQLQNLKLCIIVTKQI